ncbi:S1 RNA-binding domain-containing protein [Streptomyces sp. NPDC048383]|uniref:S1 RNA-binding domain-containing protein n=1 Tax=Streptomyces sp. NPDC048383 TaxID=3155386 RepID=UPI00343E292B
MIEPSEHPELWAFLASLRPGEVLSGTVSAIEQFGAFVLLDDGPAHPSFPGVGLITLPELSWRRFEATSDVVRVGERVSCVFLQFDTYNGEARLSLRELQPDPFQAFADGVEVGDRLTGQITKMVPFGVFVEVADGIEGLVHLRELAGASVKTPQDVVAVGDTISVVVTGLDRERRTVSLSQRQISHD